jgi:hypothetical protein
MKAITMRKTETPYQASKAPQSIRKSPLLVILSLPMKATKVKKENENLAAISNLFFSERRTKF